MHLRILLILTILFFSSCKYTFASEKSVIHLIQKNSDLSIFYNYLVETGLDKVLKKKLPWNWTIFAPSNKAFNELPELVKSEILSVEHLSKNLFMDHILAGHKTSLDVKGFTTEITVSNKKLQIYKTNSLFVKDMIVTKEDLMAKNGVVHVINCVMFVQPSIQDDRLTPENQRDYPVTSCCMRTEKEVSAWKLNTKIN